MKVPILIPNIFNHPFTYETSLKLKLGDYVIVPFGKSEVTGVVWDEFEKNKNKSFAIKKVSKKPLNAIDTLNTLKLLQMMYKSSEKKTWIKFNDKDLNSKLGK